MYRFTLLTFSGLLMTLTLGLGAAVGQGTKVTVRLARNALAAARSA